MKKIFILCLGSVFLFADIYVGIPGGYKDAFSKVIKIYNKKNNEKIKALYGPMGILMSQAKLNTLDIIIGDKLILQKNNFKPFTRLGYGTLVILSKKKITSLKQINTFHLMALPNPKSTTFGLAAQEAFKNLHIKPHTLTVSLMPQGINYLSIGECDAAIANKTQQILLKNKFYSIKIPTKYYNPIAIGFVPLGNNKKIILFEKFLKSNETKKILQSYGL